jgi:hypothetical protein
MGDIYYKKNRHKNYQNHMPFTPEILGPGSDAVLVNKKKKLLLVVLVCVTSYRYRYVKRRKKNNRDYKMIGKMRSYYFDFNSESCSG